MRYSRWFFWGGLTAALILGSSGCATRGYVRNQVGNLNRQLSAKDGELYNDIEAIRGRASSAQARADEAFNGADLARKLALGNEGYREASRYRVFFDFDKADLSDAACATLDEAAEKILQSPQYLIEVCGFTDPTGTDAYNLQLGERRAEAVRRFLVSKDPAELNRFQSISFGRTPPEKERNGWGDGAQRRQVAVVLVERTADTAPAAISQNSSGPENPDATDKLNQPDHSVSSYKSAVPETPQDPTKVWILKPQEKSEPSK